MSRVEQYIASQGATLRCDYSALLFDLDGTVLDTEESILASYHYACDTVLGYRLNDQELLDLVGIPLPEQIEKLAPAEYGEAMVKAYREHQQQYQDDFIKDFPGIEKVLKTFADASWPMAVVTSKRIEPAWQGLNLFKLGDYFQLLIGAEDSKNHKPLPDPLLLAAERMSIQPENCVYIGDSPYDMQAAKAAGMLAVGAEWGFFSYERLVEAGANFVVESCDKLPEALSYLQLRV